MSAANAAGGKVNRSALAEAVAGARAAYDVAQAEALAAFSASAASDRADEWAADMGAAEATYWRVVSEAVAAFEEAGPS